MSRIGKIIEQPIKSFANSKLMEKVCKQYRKNNSKFITGFSVGALVTKDAYGCFEYVRQNQNNENISPEKRKFISALDLLNGTMMIGIQLLAYATIAKKTTQSKIFDKVLGKHFNAKNYKKIKAKTPELTVKDFKTYKDNISTAFTHLFTLATTTILAKRVIVPLVATPMADKLKDKFEQKA